MLRLILAILSVAFLSSSTPCAQIRSVTSVDGAATAYLVPRGHPTSLMTEVWFSRSGQQDPVRLGVFMGKPGVVELRPDDGLLLYEEPGLGYIPNGTVGPSSQGLALLPNRIWRVPFDGRPVERVRGAPGEGVPTLTGSPDGIGAAPALPADPGVESAHSEVQRHLNGWTRGRQEVYRGAYRIARRSFRDAARGLREAARGARGYGLIQASLKGYADAVGSWNANDDTLDEIVCREHVLVLGDLWAAYAIRHDGDGPQDLEALLEWRSTEEATGSDALSVDLKRILRCPAARGSHVPACSYELLPDNTAPQAFLKCFWHPGAVQYLVADGGECLTRSRPFRPGELDSLLDVGVNRLSTGDAKGAVLPVRIVVHQRPKDKTVRLEMGRSFLAAGQHEAAAWAFRRAGALDMRDAEPFYGLGLVHIEQPRRRYEAIKYFQKALLRNQNHADARYQIALARYAMNERDTVKELQRVLAIDPEYADAYLLMGDWYATYWEDYERAIVWYTRYLALRPKDQKATQRLGTAYVKAKNYDKILDSLVKFLRRHPDAVGLMPVISQAFANQKKFDKAEEFFTSYVDWLDEEERTLYEDIRFVASPEEIGAYENTSGEQRATYLRTFWARHDPDVTTPANERLVEHYRRVWYARQEFSEGEQPWDRRGDVYVRFGEPEHRSSSSSRNFARDLKVQRVKERLAADLYGSDAAMHTFTGPVFPVETFSLRKDVLGMETSDPEMFLEAERDDASSDEADLELRQLTLDSGERDGSVGTGQNGPGQLVAATIGDAGAVEDLIPSASEAVADLMQSSIATNPFGFEGWAPGLAVDEDKASILWETWTYLNVDGGIEISFTDEFGNGAYGFAQVPSAPGIPIGLMVNLRRYAPREVFARAVRLSPDFYAPDFGVEHFDFYYTLAGFRGTEGRTAVEIYYGLPGAAASYDPGENKTSMVISRALAMLPAAADTVYRESGDFVLQADGNRMGRNAVLPDIARVEVSPGTYRLEVKARDRLSGRLGIYRQQIVVPDYGDDALRLSDVELAWRITESDGEGSFVKNGLEVLPMPSRTYHGGQNVFVYYEIYNLVPDEFGSSRYKVTYKVGPKGGNVLSSLVRTLTGKGSSREVAVGYEQLGTGESEVVFTEIDLEHAVPGRHYLNVEVQDLVSGRTTKKETTFVVAE